MNFDLIDKDVIRKRYNKQAKMTFLDEIGVYENLEICSIKKEDFNFSKPVFF